MSTPEDQDTPTLGLLKEELQGLEEWLLQKISAKVVPCKSSKAPSMHEGEAMVHVVSLVGGRGWQLVWIPGSSMVWWHLIIGAGYGQWRPSRLGGVLGHYK